MDPYSMILFVFLFALSAFFSGTEIALMSLPKHKIDSLVKQDKYGSKTLKKIKENNDKLLIAILIGNNLVNVFTASLATKLSIDFANKSGLEQNLAIGVSTGVITLLLLMFGEIFPKTFATKNAEKISLIVAKPYEILMIILWPIIFIISLINKLFSRKKYDEDVITDEEIEAFIDMGKDAGTIEEAEYEKLKNILNFDERSVEEIMVPRVKIDRISQETTIEEAVKYSLEHTHSRLPVFDKTVDKIDFVVTTKELLKELYKGNNEKKLKEIKLTKVLKVPLNQPIDNLLETFQKSEKHIAIVMDEYGGVAGLVTLEDVIEEVFGDIKDETDKEIEEIKREGDSYKVQPDVLINELLNKLNLNIKDTNIDENLNGETVSYVITHTLERFPSTGEKISFNIINQENKLEEKNNILEIIVTEINNGTIGELEAKIN
ncbi:MAG: hemolysin family protein [Candidatus Gracilibacteria bacterium]|nr:hemolysin family protein [Candidatus Gracilibacteria bacterium]